MTKKLRSFFVVVVLFVVIVLLARNSSLDTASTASDDVPWAEPVDGLACRVVVQPRYAGEAPRGLRQNGGSSASSCVRGRGCWIAESSNHAQGRATFVCGPWMTDQLNSQADSEG